MSQALPKIATVAAPTPRNLSVVPSNPERQKLIALVANWRSRNGNLEGLAPKAPLTVAPMGPPTWNDFLSQHGYSDRKLGWASSLASDPKHLLALRVFLGQADSDSVSAAKAELSQAVLDELERFSRGLSLNPASDRLMFVLHSSNLEELYKMTGTEGFAEELEAALQGFDQQVESRRKAVETRLAWKPERSQSRVDKKTNQSSYIAGQPKWWSGRLNDAPELLGHKLDVDKAEEIAVELEKSLLTHFANAELPKAKWANVRLENTYFSQGLEPRVQFGELKDAPGVEGYLKGSGHGGPRVLEFPLEDGKFAYLMFDGHHRAAAQIIKGALRFRCVTVMYLNDVQESYGLSQQDILEAIRDLHTHLYMTDTPVPRDAV